MRSRLAVLAALLLIGSLAMAVPASAAAQDERAKPKPCALKKKAKCKKAKLKGIKVGKQDLSGANLKGATITGVTFTGTTLTDADFRGATLRDVTFARTAMDGVDFSSARLSNVRFERVQAGSASERRARSLECMFTQSGPTFATLGGCLAAGSGAEFRGTEFRNVAFVAASFFGGDFSGSTFHNSGFGLGRVSDSLFVDVDFVDSGFLAVDISGSVFDDSRGFMAERSFGVAKMRYDDASFFRAKRASFKPQQPTNVRGLDGGASVTVQRGTGAPAYGSIRMSAPVGSRYEDVTSCDAPSDGTASGTCRGVFAKGDAMTVTVTASARLTLSGGGWTCAAPVADGSSFASTCTGTLTTDVTLTYQAPTDAPAAPVQKSVAVTVDQMGYGPPTIGNITISTVVGGVVTTVRSCDAASSCSALIDVGSVVRITVSDALHTVMAMCPGSTAWSTGSPLASPPSVLSCDDFTLATDVTALVHGS